MVQQNHPVASVNNSIVSSGNNINYLLDHHRHNLYPSHIFDWSTHDLHLNWKTTTLEQVYKQNHQSFVGIFAQMLLCEVLFVTLM